MTEYHHDFWLGVTAAGPLIALAIATTNINRYFIAAIKERIWGGPSPYPEARDLRRAAQAQLLYNVVAWCGFSATAFATLTALLSLARYRDAFGAHLGPDLAIAALVVAGTALPVLGLCERLLRQRLKRVGMGIDDLR